MKEIGIFLPGANGDIMTAMSVLKYKETLWPDKNIIWFCSEPESETLKYAPIEIKPWENFTELIHKKINGKLNHDLKHQFDSIKNLEEGYFPAPWFYDTMDPEREGVPYPNISKNIFNVPQNYEWHPQLYFSEEEKNMAEDFCKILPYKKTIMLETVARSGQSDWDFEMSMKTIDICRKNLGNCNFIFASVNAKRNSSGQFTEFFPIEETKINEPGIVFSNNFTIRQSALLNNYSDLFIGVSSGISVAVNCWGNKSTPKIQYTNTYQCSTAAIANGPFELIEIHAENNPKVKFYNKLQEMLGKL